jgi:uncharacterized protein (TIGR04255 family)
MRFPESPRVVYRNNPIVEVICQLRFPRILRIDAELPIAFHERIRSHYPGVFEAQTGLPAAPLTPDVAHAVGIDPTVLASTQRAFDFVSEDGAWRVSLTSQFLALTSSNYTRWEDFKARLAPATDALASEYRPLYFTRLGLRYRDLIQRSKLDLVDQAWSKLLRHPLLGELALPEFEQATNQAMREIVLNLDYDDARVRLLHGFAQLQGGSETCYLIDADLFSDRRVEKNDAEAILDRFNREAGCLFRWCIAEPLQRAMQPEPA